MELQILKRFKKFNKVYVSHDSITGISPGIVARYQGNGVGGIEAALTGESIKILCSLLETENGIKIRKTTRTVEVTAGKGRWKFPLLKRSEREIPDLTLNRDISVQVPPNLVRIWGCILLSGLFENTPIVHHTDGERFRIRAVNQMAGFTGALQANSNNPVTFSLTTPAIQSIIPLIADSQSPINFTPDGIFTDQVTIKNAYQQKLHTGEIELWEEEKGEEIDIPLSIFKMAGIISDSITIKDGKAVSVTDTAEMEIDADINNIGISINPVSVVRAFIAIRTLGDVVFKITPRAMIIKNALASILIPAVFF